MSGDPPSADDARSRGATTRPQPSRLSLLLYVLGIAGLGGVALVFSYFAFASGFVQNVDTVVTDPVTAVQEQTVGFLAFLGVVVSVIALLAFLVVVGSRYFDVTETADRS